MLSDSRSLQLRQLLAITSALILLISLVVTLISYYSLSAIEGLDDISFNELTNESVKSRVEFSRSIFQVGLLIIGALWASLIAKKNEAGIVLSDYPEIIMFMCASLLLLASLICHSLYLFRVSSVYYIGGKVFHPEAPSLPDIFDPSINNPFVFQYRYLIAGFLIAIFTLFSAHKLKEGQA